MFLNCCISPRTLQIINIKSVYALNFALDMQYVNGDISLVCTNISDISQTLFGFSCSWTEEDLSCLLEPLNICFWCFEWFLKILRNTHLVWILKTRCLSFFSLLKSWAFNDSGATCCLLWFPTKDLTEASQTWGEGTKQRLSFLDLWCHHPRSSTSTTSVVWLSEPLISFEEFLP